MSDIPEPGFWLRGQVFRGQPLADLWDFWHWQQPGGLAAALAQGYVELDGERLWREPASDLQPGQRYALYLAIHQEAAVNTGWQLLWQNPELLLVHKPPHLPVSRTTRNLFDTLISLVRRETQYDDAHLLHRLDAETSGLMLLAKNSHCDKKWKKRLDRLLARKQYLALVQGRPGWQHYRCETLLAERQDSAIRSRIYVVDPLLQQSQPDLYGTARVSVTRFECLASVETPDGWQSLIRCDLETGRRHQIRAQLAWLGLPIVGDKIYSHDGCFYLKRLQQSLDDNDLAALGADHHLLHAFEITLCQYGQCSVHRDPWVPDSWPLWARQYIGLLPAAETPEPVDNGSLQADE